jgi:hypothetical protein
LRHVRQKRLGEIPSGKPKRSRSRNVFVRELYVVDGMIAAELDELERLAASATPGPWRCDERSYVEAIASGIGRLNWRKDSMFIALANPSTVLALIAELRKWKDLAERKYEAEAARDQAIVDDAVAAEMERCAKIADEQERHERFLKNEHGVNDGIATAMAIAAAIRGCQKCKGQHA